MKLAVVAVAVLLLFGAPVLLESAALSEASTDVTTTDDLTVGNGSYQSLGNTTLYQGSETVESGNSTLTRGEDYEIDYVNGSIAFTDCAAQGFSAGTSGCPTEGEPASVTYEYGDLDERGEPIALLVGELSNSLSYLLLLIALIAVIAKASS